MQIKKVNDKWVCGCDKYPDCKASWWLPRSVKTAKPSAITCRNCSTKTNSTVYKLNVELDDNMMHLCVRMMFAVCVIIYGQI